MDKAEILLIVNSVLLSFLSVMFVIIGYFLKDLHRDFKQMVEKVNNLYSEHKTHVTLSDNFDTNINSKVSVLQREIRVLSLRCDKLENKKS
jgi:hypothetical protein